MLKGPSLYEEAKKLIPGGSNLFSKRGEVHAPGVWPQYYKSAKGAEIVDLDGNRFLDFSGAGVGACVLGYADDDVDNAVIRTIKSGSTSALLGTEEVELAKLLIHLHPWAQQVRYTRSGGEAIAVAIRIAQAKTGRKAITRLGSYHGWHVNDPRTGEDFLPTGLGEVAALIVEPSRLTEPRPGELEGWRAVADRAGAVLIFDEISSGFRRQLGGVHLHYGVTPDIAVFSKAIANGYPMGAVIGTERCMSAVNNTFISSTSWSERTGPAAALATIQKLWATDPFKSIDHIGYLVRNTIVYNARRCGLDIKVDGPNSMLHFTFESPEQQTAYTVGMLSLGILAGRDFYPSAAHTLEHVEAFSLAVHHVFETLNTIRPQTVVEQGVRRITRVVEQATPTSE
jgi:glutamate-1-semialdehyde 2,1-aminomutase